MSHPSPRERPSTFAKHACFCRSIWTGQSGRSHGDENDCSKLFLYTDERCRVLCDRLVAESGWHAALGQGNVAHQQRYEYAFAIISAWLLVSSVQALAKFRSSRQQARIDYTRTRTRSAVANEALERLIQCLAMAVSRRVKRRLRVLDRDNIMISECKATR